MSWHYPKRGKKSGGGLKLHATADAARGGGAAWGPRWLAAVSKFFSETQRERGRKIAAAGQVLSVQVDQGFATVEVQGSRARPYQVEIGLTPFTREQWTGVVDALLVKALFAAKLLAGEMPREVEPMFRRAGAPLFPTSEDDFSADCSCAEVDVPCKHAAAACHLLAQEFDQNPFLLMEMRGLTRAQLLAEIQSRRGAAPAGARAGGAPSAAPAIERPPQTALAHRLADFFDAAKDQPLAWPSRPDAPLLKPAARLQEMGAPPAWPTDNDFADVMAKIYQAVRKRALE